ncbi:MAG: Bug family tripartite tricarboxylate transporter substrate binding protein [Burkholderiaceae bacterium]
MGRPTSRRTFALGLGLVPVAASLPVRAQDWKPAKPITILIGLSPGGPTDIIARLLAAHMQEVLKVSVIVESKPGAGQAIAIQSMKARPADGTTLFLGTGGALSLAPAVRKDLAYQPMQDLAFVSMVALQPGVIVVPASSSIPDGHGLIRYAKANPGKLNYGSQGIGSSGHMAMEYVLTRTGTTMNHVPFKGDSEILREMLGDRIDVAIMSTGAAVPHARNGGLRILCTTSTGRLSSFPDLPSLSDVGLDALTGLDPFTYFAMVAKAGTPDEVVAVLNRGINAALAVPSIAEQLRKVVLVEPANSTPEGLLKLVKEDTAKWSEIATRSKIEIN